MIVYKVTNKINGKCYVGQTKHELDRVKIRYLSDARMRRFNYQFYQDIRDFGIDNFEWEVICKCESMGELKEKRAFYIHEYRTRDVGYNRVPGNKKGSESCLWGVTLSEEHRQKISEALMGHPVSEETRQRIGNFWRGKSLSDEHRQKISKTMMGHPVAEKSVQIVTCPHCDVVGSNLIMHRWHFDKCKHKKWRL